MSEQRNAARQKEIERAEDEAKRADDDLRWVMSTQQGRRHVWRELGRNGLYTQTYSPNNSDHCFKAGQRNAALTLLVDVMRVAPENYLLMQQEAIEADRLARAEQQEQDDEQ